MVCRFAKQLRTCIKALHEFSKVYQDIGESYFFSNPLFAFPTGDTTESTFLDMYMRRKDFYFSNMMRPVSSISVNHTFKFENVLEASDYKITNSLMKT